MPADLKPIYPSELSDDPVAAAAGFIVPSEYNAGVKLEGGSNKEIVVCDTTQSNRLNTTDSPTVKVVHYTNVVPSAPEDGDEWTIRTGTSPLRTITHYVRDNGVTYVSWEITV
jgi:hypothetical protein